MKERNKANQQFIILSINKGIYQAKTPREGKQFPQLMKMEIVVSIFTGCKCNRVAGREWGILDQEKLVIQSALCSMV